MNIAAWQPSAKADLEIGSAPLYEPGEGQLLIKNQSFPLQPLDAKVRALAYLPLPYPFILGTSLAGVVEKVGPGVTAFSLGDRVVSDTPGYLLKDPRFGAWQKYTLSTTRSTVLIKDRDFDQAAAIPFALLTVAAAFYIYLGMPRPGTNKAASDEKVLVYGAGGSTGGYAVQYAKAAGFSVVVTASERSHSHLLSLGASKALDYKSASLLEDLKALGPFRYIMCGQADMNSQQTVAKVVAGQGGGKFASMGPGEAEFPHGVERIYAPYGQTIYEKGREGFVSWWYGEYLPKVIQDGLVEPTPVVLRSGGLGGIQEAAKDVLAGAKGKMIIHPQD